VALIPNGHQVRASTRLQEASYFTLRGASWQIIAIDTGLLNNQQLSSTMLPFLPDDQQAWAVAQVTVWRSNS
jgi:hypothetical protein